MKGKKKTDLTIYVRSIEEFIIKICNYNRPLSIIIFGTIIFLLRSWERVFTPEVWVEDGIFNIPGIIDNGVKGFFDPVNGYVILISKLITYISLNISVLYYHLISTLLVSILTIYTFYAVATSPLKLKGKIWLAVFIFLIPTHTEVFAKPSYAFWWTNILLFTTLFWNPEKRQLLKRAIFIIISSLSSPVAIVALPVFLYRGVKYYKKYKSELYISMIAICSIIPQVMVMLSSPHKSNSTPNLLDTEVYFNVIKKYFGYYLYYDFNVSIYMGIVLAMVLLIIFLKTYKSYHFFILFYLLTATIAITLKRIDINITDPITAGPRYYFYQYILISWILISSCYLHFKDIRFHRFVKVLLIIMVMNLLPYLSKGHDSLYWKKHIVSASFFNNYQLPISYSEECASRWHIFYGKQKYKALLEKDPFYNSLSAVSYPFSRSQIRYFKDIQRLQDQMVSIPNSQLKKIKENKLIGKDYYSVVNKKNSIKGYQVVGTFNQLIVPEADTPIVIRIKMKKGQSIWYRTEPESKHQYIRILNHENKFISSVDFINRDWSLFNFSNDLLPNEFYVEFADEGKGYGEWFAIAFRK